VAAALTTRRSIPAQRKSGHAPATGRGHL